MPAHDKFMKALLSDLEMARDYFTQFLPEPLKEIVNLSALSHSGTSFISGMKEGEFFADMVFECPLKSGQGKLYLSILVEHKSFKNKYVYIQLGRYLFGAYEQQLKAKSESLTPVIPFLYYHGGEVWHPENMHQFFRDYPAVLLDYIPEFKIIFRNVGDYTEEQLLQLGNAMLASALTTQKYSHDPTRL
ncbi:Rpn family recombination-promoting nuclease/putative transposase [Membranihabitans maritimus]|uniref:Rpn family recombination-promoting nuclease/putative transposase n=1 Tax=Membranihabitans maritimus TaxID=2904244 RepID=UPI003F6F8143